MHARAVSCACAWWWQRQRAGHVAQLRTVDIAQYVHAHACLHARLTRCLHAPPTRTCAPARLRREVPGAPADPAAPWESVQFRVKWRRLSYAHCSWEGLGCLRSRPGAKRVTNYIKRVEALAAARPGLSREEAELLDVTRQMEEQLQEQYTQVRIACLRVQLQEQYTQVGCASAARARALFACAAAGAAGRALACACC